MNSKQVNFIRVTVAIIVVTVTWYFVFSMALASVKPQVVVHKKCLAAEDSAAHLKLISYSPELVVYGCYHHGY